MTPTLIRPTGIERTFGPEEIIVSKTDTSGRITYTNDVFLRVSRFAEHDIVGRPHNIIRHPDMPRSIFALLWHTIQRGEEVFAYVVNLAADGAHYWVLGHVTATCDRNGAITGYHSNRRCPGGPAVASITRLYEQVRQAERNHTDPRQAIAAGTTALETAMQRTHADYHQYVWSLIDGGTPTR